MTATQDKSLQISLAGSLAFHALLLVVLAWFLAVEAVQKWNSRSPEPVVEEKEVTLIFPEQILPEPPPAVPEPEPKDYIRTTQNEAEMAAPKKADFISDRNTTAASEKAADPDGTAPMPTTDGAAFPMKELVDRDQKQGEIREDAAGKMEAGLTPPPPAPAPAMKTPVAESSPASRPSPPSLADAMQMAKVEPAANPLDQMIREMDEEMARVDLQRLPLDVQRALPANAPPAQPMAASEAANETPVPKAVPMAETVDSPDLNASPDAFVPFTRTSKVKGTISNRGKASVNAEETPMGRYMRAVTSQVEKKWHTYRRRSMDAVTFGSLKLEFYVTPDGRSEDLRIVSDPRNADPLMADFTLQAIRDAEIPPIPDDLVPMLEAGRMRIEYDVLIY